MFLRSHVAAWLVLAMAAGGWFVACSGGGESKKADPKPKAPVEAAPPPDAGPPPVPSSGPQLLELSNRYSAFLVAEYPEFATWMGDHSADDKLHDPSEAARKRREPLVKEMQEQLKAIPEAGLTPAELNLRDALAARLADHAEALRLELHLLDVDPVEGPQAHGFALLMTRVHPRATPKDLENLLSRYKAFGPYMDAVIANLRAGMAKKVTVPKSVVKAVVAQLKELTSAKPDKSIFAVPASAIPASATAEQKAALQKGIPAAVKDGVLPAYARFKKFLEKEYMAAARADAGLSTLPNGADIYAALVRRYTTRDIKADDLLAAATVDLQAVEGEMMDVAITQKHKQNAKLSAFTDKLRKDKKNRPKNAKALVAAYQEAVAAAQARMADVLEKEVGQKLEVVEMDKRSASAGRPADYLPGSVEGRLAVNGVKPDARLMFNVPAMAFHHGVPGSHLRTGLLRQAPGSPAFLFGPERGPAAEGWAVYAERLAAKLKLYTKPLDRFGMLGMRALAASRAITDINLHAKGWNRKQAVDFLKEHCALSVPEVEAEVDGILARPGSGLAPLVGAMEVAALRQEAQQRLGDNLPIKNFHTTLLSAGNLPLDALRRHMTAWLDQLAPPPPPVVEASSSLAPPAAPEAQDGGAAVLAPASAPSSGSPATPSGASAPPPG